MAGIQLFKDAINDAKVSLLIKINLGLTVFLLILMFFKIRPLFLRTEEGLTTEASKRDFCVLSMKQMIKHKLSPKLINDGLYNMVVKDNYGAISLKGNEEISSVWSSEKGCKVLLKSDQGIGSFDFILGQSEDSKFYYRINKIIVNELFDKEGN